MGVVAVVVVVATIHLSSLFGQKRPQDLFKKSVRALDGSIAVSFILCAMCQTSFVVGDCCALLRNFTVFQVPLLLLLLFFYTVAAVAASLWRFHVDGISDRAKNMAQIFASNDVSLGSPYK